MPRRKRPPRTSRKAVFQKARRSMVAFAVEQGEGQFKVVGSGFAIAGSQGLVATAAHVLNPTNNQSPTHALVVSPLSIEKDGVSHVPFSQVPLDDEVSATHSAGAIDLAITRLNHSFPPERTLPLATEGPYLGQEVATCGWPEVDNLLMGGFVTTPSFLTGIISSIVPHPRAPVESHFAYLAQLPVHAGNSGGPVFNMATGKVFGVASGRLPAAATPSKNGQSRKPKPAPDIRVGLTKVTPIVHLTPIRKGLLTKAKEGVRG